MQFHQKTEAKHNQKKNEPRFPGAFDLQTAFIGERIKLIQSDD